jgi:hypothetical protein
MVHNSPTGEDPENYTILVVNSAITKPKIQSKEFSKASMALWCVVIIAGLVLEAVGLHSINDSWPPLTHIVVTYVPQAATLGFIGWLKSHFTEAYESD